MKLYKTPITSRPVGRTFNSQMKIYEQLIGGILDQVLEDIEEERVRQGKKRIVLNSTLPCVKIIEDINNTWEKEFLVGKKLDEGVEILGYDVVTMYPSSKLEFMIREIDSINVYARTSILQYNRERRRENSLETSHSNINRLHM
jgi:hypothetical protein